MKNTPVQLNFRLEDIPNRGAKEFRLSQPPIEGFVIRINERVYAYHNRCPHTGVNLNWMPDRFLDMDERYIQCATHGALFRIEDGFCVAGPCAGAGLQALPVTLQQDRLYLTLNNDNN